MQGQEARTLKETGLTPIAMVCQRNARRGWVGVLMSPDVHFIIDPGVCCSGIDQSSCQTRGCARGQEADKISQVKGDEDLK